jgi:hypothetical protein
MIDDAVEEMRVREDAAADGLETVQRRSTQKALLTTLAYTGPRRPP